MIYIHIGMWRTGTTFLQQNVFPIWKNIEYIKSQHLKNLLQISGEKKYLISNEGLCGNPWKNYEDRELMLENLSKFFPNAKIMVAFRRHASFIASLYRQYLHEGGTLSFGDFFDIRNDTGFIKKDAIFFKPIIEFLEKIFDQKPLVFLQEDLRDNLEGVLKKIGQFFKEQPPDISNLNLTPRNRGVGYYQSKVLVKLNKINKSPLNPNGFIKLSTKYSKFLGIDPRTLCQYRLSFLSSRPMKLDKDEEDLILDYYKDDWKYVLDYIK